MRQITQGPQPNDEQQAVIDEIYNSAIYSREVIDEKLDPIPIWQKDHFICGEGGCGKTWMFNVITKEFLDITILFL